MQAFREDISRKASSSSCAFRMPKEQARKRRRATEMQPLNRQKPPRSVSHPLSAATACLAAFSFHRQLCTNQSATITAASKRRLPAPNRRCAHSANCNRRIHPFTHPRDIPCSGDPRRPHGRFHAAAGYTAPDPYAYDRGRLLSLPSTADQPDCRIYASAHHANPE